ncbi:glycosyltransferase family 15 protein [Rhodocollybia butyracea]|uniref:Glycosyltransferase family 15 protein n=1 Tax=Rhodocollybia butyracea TaxID=206335 RepID=A0A9P5Q4T6_9AGAR|nr:glycosyltransferase family 15 protein [Rhodocollybia butyracea]
MALASAFVTGSRLRLIVFLFSFILVLYMGFSVLRDDIRSLAIHHLYSSTPNTTSKYPITARPPASESLPPPIPGKANATLVFLARNSDLQGVLKSMRSVERHFNSRYKYPWVFLNEEEFTDEFKADVMTMTNASVQFGVIPARHWYQPEWIDEARAEQGRKAMQELDVIYADSVSYRNMCRFNSGFFFRHPLLQPYRYYWRIEPDVEYFCEINYDPFDYLEENNKTYGFTITLVELHRTVLTLWDAVKEFMEQYPQYIAENNAMRFISDNGGDTYNLCHFWSNFEISDMDFWRSEAYTKFFEFLDSKGGFYYERWGDAPVHSIAAALFLDKNQLHFFNDIGYQHSTIMHCPQQPLFLKNSCTCNRVHTIDYRQHSCLMKYNKMLTGRW